MFSNIKKAREDDPMNSGDKNTESTPLLVDIYLPVLLFSVSLNFMGGVNLALYMGEDLWEKTGRKKLRKMAGWGSKTKLKKKKGNRDRNIVTQFTDL